MRRRRPEERSADEPVTRPEPGARPGGILALQQSAGNHAVTQMLARKEGDKPPAAGKAAGDADFGKGRHRIPLLSMQFAQQPSPRGSRKEGEEEKETAHEVSFTSESGPHTTELMKWAIDGTAFPSVTVTLKGMKFVLRECLVTGFQTGGAADAPVETWSLSCAKVDFEAGEPG